jgi:hypothetical protein
MATSVTPPLDEKVSQIENRLRQLESMRVSVGTAPVASAPRPPSLWFTNLLQGVTLVTIAACAFWLGSLSSTVSTTSGKLDKLNDAVMGISKDSLSSRVSVIETKLDEANKKLDTFQPK